MPKSRYDRATGCQVDVRAVKRWTVSCEVSDAAPAGAGSRDRYATPRCVKGKNVWEGRPAVFMAVAGSRRRQRGKGWSLNRSQAEMRASERPSFPRFLHTVSLSKLFLPVYRVRARLKVVPLRATRRIRSDRLPATSLQRQEPQAQILGAGGRKALPPFRDSVPLSAVFWASNAISRIRVALGGLHLDSVRGPAPRENSTSTENVRRCTWRADRTYEARASR